MGPKFIVNARFLEKDEAENSGVLRFEREISIRLKAYDPRIQFLSSTKIESNPYSIALNPITFGFSHGAIWEQVELPFFISRKFKGHYLLNLNNISPLLYRRNISTIHDLNWKHLYNLFDKKSRFYLSKTVPLTIRNAKKILTVSNFSKQDLLKYYNVKGDNIKVIYPGFINDFKKNSLREKDTQNGKEFNFTQQKYFLASMYKNPDRLIEAFKQLRDLDIKLVFFGSFFKEVFGHLIPEIESSKNIVYLGKVSDSLLFDLYSNAIAFVFPSLNEGFGMPPLEAMSCKCPVIASNLSSIPEVCDDAVLYIDPFDINDIATKMRSVYFDYNLRNELIKKGERRILRFSYDKTVSELVDFLKSIGGY